MVNVYVACRVSMIRKSLLYAAAKHSHKGPGGAVDQRIIPFTQKVKFQVVHICHPVDLCVCENAFISVFGLSQVK